VDGIQVYHELLVKRVSTMNRSCSLCRSWRGHLDGVLKKGGAVEMPEAAQALGQRAAVTKREVELGADGAELTWKGPRSKPAIGISHGSVCFGRCTYGDIMGRRERCQGWLGLLSTAKKRARRLVWVGRE
jgi:hypothetical protein